MDNEYKERRKLFLLIFIIGLNLTKIIIYSKSSLFSHDCRSKKPHPKDVFVQSEVVTTSIVQKHSPQVHLQLQLAASLPSKDRISSENHQSVSNEEIQSLHIAFGSSLLGW